MNFELNHKVWLVDPDGNRFAAVAVEPPGDAGVFTFAFLYDHRVVDHIAAKYGRPCTVVDGLLEGDVNELEPGTWDEQFALIPGEGRRCYAIMATRDRGDGAYFSDEAKAWRYADTGLPPHPPDDFDCEWDGFKVEPRD